MDVHGQSAQHGQHLLVRPGHPDLLTAARFHPRACELTAQQKQESGAARARRATRHDCKTVNTAM
eukprot:9078574-Alexandrium_andersonii.AAC.1